MFWHRIRTSGYANRWLTSVNTRLLSFSVRRSTRSHKQHIPLRHRLSRFGPPSSQGSSKDGYARPGELPALQFSHAQVPEAMSRSFTSPPLSPGLVRMVHELLGERARPTTPQAQALAHFFSRQTSSRSAQHTLIAAETGSGKTLAYLLPLLQRLHETRAKTEHADLRHVRAGAALVQIMPRSIILAPTHELARQIAEVAKVLCHDASHKLRVACSSKPSFSVTIKNDLAHLSELAVSTGEYHGAPLSPDVLVTTPAFIAEHMDDDLSLRHVQMLVIDEADTLLDEGFRTLTQKILRETPGESAHVFVTATIPRSMRMYLDDAYPSLVTLASPHLHHLPQRLSVMFVDPGGNKDLAVVKELFRVFTTPGCEKDQVLIFRDKRSGVESLSRFLHARNVDHVAWTGAAEDRKTRTSQHVAPFLAGPSEHYARRHHRDVETPRVLVTTSLLSRGLDFGPHLRHVFLPDAGRNTTRSVHAANNNALELLHRAGRSARAGRAGTVVVFDKNSAPGKTKVLLNRRGQKKGIVRGQMDLLVRALQRPSKSSRRRQRASPKSTS